MDKSDKNKTIKALEEAGIDPTQLDPEAFTLIDAKAEKDYFNTEEYQTVLVDLEKSENLNHMKENLSIFNFDLTPTDMAMLGLLNKNLKI